MGFLVVTASALPGGARYHGMEHSIAFTLVLQENAANVMGFLVGKKDL
jgi:hypothetical protein